MATLPPWLEVTPQLYAGTAEAGLRAGLQSRELTQRGQEFGETMDLNREKQAQETALAAQEMQMKGMNMKLQLAQFMQNMKQQNLDNQLKVEKFKADKDIAEQSLAVDKHYKEQMMDFHMGQAANQEKRYQMQADVAARKFQAQQAALQRIHAGEDPAKVFLDLGGALGESASGLAALYKDTLPKPEAQPDTGPDIVERDGQRFLKHTDRFGTVNYTELRQGGGVEDKNITHLVSLVKAYSSDIRSGTPGTPQYIQLKKYQDALDKALKLGEPGGGGAGIRTATPFTETRPFTEAGDYRTPGHEEPGETEAPTPPSRELMSFPPQPYRLPLGIP